jgi:predicted HTH transcriptional regulator
MSADFENNYFPSIVLIVISLTDIIKQCDYVFVRVRTLPTKLEDTRGGIRSRKSKKDRQRKTYNEYLLRNRKSGFYYKEVQ